MTEKELCKRLSLEFYDVNIVTLNELTTKIAIASKVRTGNIDDRTDNAYDEISLYNIDSYGVIFIPKNAKIQENANPTSLRSQTLNYGDLVLNQRTLKMRVGFIGKEEEYTQRIVANNSMIRIEFNDKDCLEIHRNIDTSRFVQLYLQLPYVLEYLRALPNTSSGDRKIISALQLSLLPIPEYNEHIQSISLSTLLYPKMELIKQAKILEELAATLIKKYEKDKLEVLKVNFLASSDSSSHKEEILAMEALLEKIERINALVEGIEEDV
ncbi:hypothetical protein JHD48_07825 [Sulfurimonas sp. SAG-AH-194-I05]|nr:hypothetical protein [Sulfurimonas sp. SAG-AH-194-I05]MDF1875639.1 hypothetical protein [Sulfurimonas sp. SAG-AH-194-I05]